MSKLPSVDADSKRFNEVRKEMKENYPRIVVGQTWSISDDDGVLLRRIKIVCKYPFSEKAIWVYENAGGKFNGIGDGGLSTVHEFNLRYVYRAPDITYDPDAANLVADKDGKIVGIITRWNPHGLGEAIVQYFDGSADSAFFKELIFPNGADKARQFLNRTEW
jgi:hypothetical protein